MGRYDDELRLNDWFWGSGGSTHDVAASPGVRPVHAANHWGRAIESPTADFPEVDHHLGAVCAIDRAKLPHAELFSALPEGPQWPQANGQAAPSATL